MHKTCIEYFIIIYVIPLKDSAHPLLNVCLLEPLGKRGERYRHGLNSVEWMLVIERISATIDSTKLQSLATNIWRICLLVNGKYEYSIIYTQSIEG